MTRQHELFPDDPPPSRFARRSDFFAPKPKRRKKPPEAMAPPEEPAGPGCEPTLPEPAAVPLSAPTPPAPTVYTVAQLARLIRRTLDEHLPSRVLVRGQLSGWRPARSGHVYGCLKDEAAAVDIIAWRSLIAKLKFEPADGLEVIATGRMEYYEPRGQLRLILDKLEPAGVGALELAFRQLAEKLRGEGLFEDRHKQPLPRYPLTIAIVTSPTGAAVQDIDRTLRQRWPIARKLLFPVAVQGDNAPGEIARALGEINRRAAALAVDVIILGRGGGSIEDLWAFNEEVVARAVFASRVPVISGVGHEIDTTICDLVADARAATPTAAAQLAAPDRLDVLENVANVGRRLRRGFAGRFELNRHKIEQLAGRPCFRRPEEIVRFREQRVDELTRALESAWARRRHQIERQLGEFARILRQIEPHLALKRTHEQLLHCRHRLGQVVQASQWHRNRRIERLALQLAGVRPQRRTEQLGQALDQCEGRLRRGAMQTAARRHERLEGLQARLAGLDPRAVLRRGYSITRTESGELVTPETPVQPGELLWTELAEQVRLQSRVTEPPRKENDIHDQRQ